MSEPKKPAKPRAQSVMGNPITELTGGSKKTPAPRKPRAKTSKNIPEPTETSPNIVDPFVPDEFGVIPPQTGDGLTIKGVPLVFVPGEAETIQGALNSAFLETQLERRHPATFPSSLLPAGKAFEAISQPTSANFIGSLENTEQAPGKTEASDGSSQSPLPTNSADEKNVGDRFQQDNSTLDTGEYENAGLDAGTTQVDPQATEKNQGDIAIGPAAADSQTQVNAIESVLPSHARLPGEGRAAFWERTRKALRSVGMPRGQGPGTAYEMATRETERLFPPKIPEPVIIEEIPDEPETSTIVDEKSPQVEPIPEVAPPAPPPDLGVSGLGELPESWGNLPANAQLQVEIAWVSANRLRVRSGNGVDLSRAISPAPSYSALSWLETSILFPSKFADVQISKLVAGQQDDEREFIKREKMAIEEIRSILAEMLEE